MDGDVSVAGREGAAGHRRGGMPRADLGRAGYAVAQSLRVAWFASQYMLARQVAGPVTPPDEPPFAPKSAPADMRRVRDAFLGLFAQDRANIEEGLYPPPPGPDLGAIAGAFAGSVRFFRDLPRLDKRRLARQGVEVRNGADRSRFPTYYLQNFHYQTDGWLSEESARLYDTQVEVLFAGAADAMRRIALGELARVLRGRDQRKLRMADIACGNGRFLEQVMEAFPRLRASGLDLSPPYLKVAGERLARWSNVSLIVGQAEAAPFADSELDAATCIYLFHELPPRIRRDVAREIARVLKPGGAFVFADSIQKGETPDLDQMLEYFPIGFHEPYYGSYQEEDLVALFGEAGLTLESGRTAFLTKVLRFRKP